MDATHLSIVLDPTTNRKIINGHYRIIKKIGQGQFGKVLLGEVIHETNDVRRVSDTSWKSDVSRKSKDSIRTVDSRRKSKDSDNISNIVFSSSSVAIKTINRIDKSKLITKSYLSQTTKIKREIEIMKQCSHPNVVKLYQVIDDLKFDKILLILEYCKYGEIDWKHYNHYYEKYQKHFDRKPLTINKILRDVINGLEYLHSVKKIIHRDLKPSNLLITEDNTIKISDFGVSLILENNANDQKELGKTMGTPLFYAPELCQFVNNRLSMITKEAEGTHPSIQLNDKIDIWSLGVILYCLIFNDLPFNGFNEFELFKNIVREELRFPKIKQTSKATEVDIAELKLLKDLIKKILVKDPEQRITIEEIKNHDFTTFDLDAKGKKRFLNFNQGVFKDNLSKEKLEAQEQNQDTDLSKKIRRLFAPKKPVSAASSIISLQTTASTVSAKSKPVSVPDEQPNLQSLELLDDLLDSYLDDSSSLTSDIDEEDFEIDTSNILEDIDPKTEVPSKDVRKSQSSTSSSQASAISLKKNKSKPQPLVLKQSTFDTKSFDNTGSLHTSGSFNSNYGYSASPRGSGSGSGLVPSTPKYKIASSSPVESRTLTSSPRSIISTKISSSPRSFNSGKTPNTPTNDHTVVIGASSPSTTSSFKAIFSPSRRFFSRNKNKNKTSLEPKPTISSLSSPAKKQKNPKETKKKYTDLMEPPPIFGLNVAYPSNNSTSDSSLKSPATAFSLSNTSSAKSSKRNSPTSNNTGSRTSSRKNSISSLTSGYGLRKITSSSSSLNLNAYLTDDSFSINSTKQGGSSNYYREPESEVFGAALSEDEPNTTIDNLEEANDTLEEEHSDTLVLNDRSEIFKNFRSMNEYLDGLDKGTE